jgi:co-chaperonin GroES (HSP10)
MRVIRDNVLIKPFASDEKSIGGIIVSEAHRAVSQKVKVVSVGNGTKKSPMNWKEGDVAFRVKDSGDEILIGGERHFIVKSGWLIAKLN